MVQGGHNVPALFSGGYFAMKKGSGSTKFLDFTQFIINFQKIKKDFGFSQCFGLI